MKIGIYTFSGTGNTAYIAKQMKNAIQSMDQDRVHQVDLYDIAKNPQFDPTIDVLILGGPIYAGNIPEKMIRWILRSIPKTATQTRAIVFTTSTGLGNAFGVDSMASKLIKKGYSVISKECFEMPRNFYFDRYLPESEDVVKNKFDDASHKVQSMTFDSLLDDSGEDRVWSDPHKGILGKDLLAELFSVIAKFMGKSLSADDSCIQCMKCVNHCPQANIRLSNGKIVFGKDCMMCTRCIHGCPVNAIAYKGKKFPQYNSFI